MITPDEVSRFERCCRDALLSEHEKKGVGTLGERTLHVVLKHFFEPDGAFHEIKIGRFVADIKRGNAITEIQTRSFGSLRAKLTALSEEYRVNVVYPIPSRKTLTWIDPETGELSPKRKSPKKGKPWDFLYELYALRPILPLPNVTFTLIFCEMDEFRMKNGWGREKKHGGSRYERIPTALTDIMLLEKPADFAALLPELPETFTAAEYAKAAKQTSRTAGYGIRTLVTLGVIEQIDKKGNAYIYKRKDF
ncbi:MAG: hypothetical protein E7632_07230 [Ruminococcaceae bacterium]|nr:hypothetical protein [Oscillospiraceae bacterium]